MSNPVIRSLPPIGGAGAKKKKSPPPPPEVRVPYEVPDNLKSNAYGRIVDLLCEGPIYGFADDLPPAYQTPASTQAAALQNVYLDETPASNYPELSIDIRRGELVQTPFKGVDGALYTEPVGHVRIDGESRVRRITAPNVTRAWINLSILGMWREKKWTERDQATGFKQKGTDVTNVTTTVTIWTKLADQLDSQYVIAAEQELKGKTRRPVRWSISIDLPEDTVGNGIDIKVSSTESSNREKREITWENYTAVIETNLSMPATSAVSLEVLASTFQAIPSRAYEIKGMLVKVPSNYDQTQVGLARYVGDWDGTFKASAEWTANPAWCLYDLLTNTRYGCGFPQSQIDKWALYEIAKYCDDTVESGELDSAGSPILEPRFEMHAVIERQEDAYRLLSDICSVFRGAIYSQDNKLRFTQNRPTDAVAEFTNADVEGGLFTVEGSARRTRATVAAVSYNDPTNFFLPTIVYIEDTPGITRYGVNQIDTLAFGTKSRGQAVRVGRWLLQTERREHDVTSFRTGFKGALLRPGDRIRVFDSADAEVRFGGLINGGTQTDIWLDAPVTLEPATSYTLSVMLPDSLLIKNAPNNTTTLSVFSLAPPNNDHTFCKVYADVDGDGVYETPVETVKFVGVTLTIVSLGGDGSLINYRCVWPVGLDERAVTTGAGTWDRLTVSTPLRKLPIVGAVWILSEANIPARELTVVQVSEVDVHKFEVVGVLYDEAKFDDVESFSSFEEYSDAFDQKPPPDFVPQAPTDVDFREEVRLSNVGEAQPVLVVDWNEPANNEWVRGYRFRHRLAGGVWQSANLTESSFEIAMSGAVVVDVEIESVTYFGQVSQPLAASYTYGVTPPLAAAKVTGLEIEGHGNRTRTLLRDWPIVWRGASTVLGFELDDTLSNGGATGADPWFKDYEVNVYDPDTNELLRTTHTTAARFVYTHAMNVDDGGPRRRVRFEVAHRDLYDQLGPYSLLTVDNPAPDLPDGVSLRGIFKSISLTYERMPQDEDVQGLVVWMGTSATFGAGPPTQVYKGGSNPIFWDVPQAGETYYVRWAAFDTFSVDADGYVNPSLLIVSGAIAVTTSKVDGHFDIKEQSIGSAVIGEAAIYTASIQDLAVEYAKIRDLAVDTVKIAGNAVSAFQEVEVVSPANIFPAYPQGEWCPVLQISSWWETGPLFVTGIFGIEVWKSMPNMGYRPVQTDITDIARNWFGARTPTVRYRVVRREVGQSDYVCYLSAPVSVSATGYVVGAAVSKLDQPSGSPHEITYAFECQWMNDIYEAGLCSYDGNTAGPSSTRRIIGTGTRWWSNVQGRAKYIQDPNSNGYNHDSIEFPTKDPGTDHVVRTVENDTQILVWTTLSTTPTWTGEPYIVTKRPMVATAGNTDLSTTQYSELGVDLTNAFMQTSRWQR